MDYRATTLDFGVVFSTIIVTALSFGLPASSLMGFGGIGGFTLGLAAKDLIANFIGGIMIAVMRPFSPGEKVFILANQGKFRSTREAGGPSKTLKP